MTDVAPVGETLDRESSDNTTPTQQQSSEDRDDDNADLQVSGNPIDEPCNMATPQLVFFFFDTQLQNDQKLCFLIQPLEYEGRCKQQETLPVERPIGHTRVALLFTTREPLYSRCGQLYAKYRGELNITNTCGQMISLITSTSEKVEMFWTCFDLIRVIYKSCHIFS